jgi:hypothetical protein
MRNTLNPKTSLEVIIPLICSTSAAMMLDQGFSIHHEAPSAAKPQLNNKDNFHHEGTKVTKEDLSRKGAKGAKEKRIQLCGLGVLARG